MSDKYNRIQEIFEYATVNNTFTKLQILNGSRNVVVYGLGKYFTDAYLKQRVRNRFNVKYLCDSNEERLAVVKEMPEADSVECITIETLFKLENPVVIFMLGDPRSAIERIAPVIGRINCITYNDLVLDELMTCSHDISYYVSQREKAIEAYKLLEDDLSREIFVNVLALRIAPHLADKDYQDMCTMPQYFPPDIVNLSNQECVCDCGAYTGDTLHVFADVVNNNFEKYYAFEMDSENFKELETNASTYRADSVQCINKGVWSSNKTINYGRQSSSDSFSIFNGVETVAAECVSIDTELVGKKITLIKMDIEGAEMQALQGAKQTIITQKPKMAVCCYHRVEDMWNIPLYLKSLRDDYRFYMRHHAEFWVSETVVYGV